MPKTDLTVKLIGEDGNALAIMGRVYSTLKKAGYKDLASQYFDDVGEFIIPEPRKGEIETPVHFISGDLHAIVMPMIT